MQPLRWKTIGVSVAGFSHREAGTPCQDYHAISQLDNGWLVATVSDGAGSARRSAEGAKAVCAGLGEHLNGRLGEHLSGRFDQQNDNCEAVLDEDTVRSWVVSGITSVRATILHTEDDPIEAFHATLVGVIAGPSGGVFFHIGDGAACATHVETFSPSVTSPPENGEYANETYFFTQPDWERHLRLTPFDRQFNLLALMSDGVMPFALAPGAAEPYEPFFSPLSRYLRRHPEDECRSALAATLENDTIRRITGDDKTLVWALRMKDA